MATKSEAILLVRQVVNFHRLSLQAGRIDGVCVCKTDVLFTVYTQDNKSSLSFQPAFGQIQRDNNVLLLVLYQKWESARKANLITIAKAFVLCICICATETLALFVYFVILPSLLMIILKEV